MHSSNFKWLTSRQSLITATDSLFILKEFNEQLSSKLEGINTYNRTRFQAYMEKVIPTEKYIEYQELASNNIMQEGKTREAEIANLAKSDLGLDIESNGETLAIKEEYKIGATPDYYVQSSDPVLILDTIALY